MPSRSTGDATPPTVSLPQAHFDALCAEKPDPWSLATAWYARRKYAITVGSLPRERYRRGYEPGCAIGELTRLLAFRCDQLLAVDFSPAAVAQSRNTVHDLPHVRVEQATIPQNLPGERFDLIVVSEILYYLSENDLRDVLTGLVKCLEPGGDLIAVHHRARDRCYGYDGFNVHSAIAECSELIRQVHHDDDGFALDVFRKHVTSRFLEGNVQQCNCLYESMSNR